jgi:hypothetical protein
MGQMRFIQFAAVAALTLLGGCADQRQAFVDRMYDATVQKPKPAGSGGVVNVCYRDDTPAEERERLAAEACADWGLRPLLTGGQRWQCTLLVPHLATYHCVDPNMRFADGVYVDPFNRQDVEDWQAEKAGKPVRHRSSALPPGSFSGTSSFVDPMATRGFDAGLK